jgi:hypothetical protein
LDLQLLFLLADLLSLFGQQVCCPEVLTDLFPIYGQAVGDLGDPLTLDLNPSPWVLYECLRSQISDGVWKGELIIKFCLCFLSLAMSFDNNFPEDPYHESLICFILSEQTTFIFPVRVVQNATL